MPSLTNATVLFSDESSLKQFKGANPATLELYKPSGEPRGSLRSILDSLIADKNFVKKLEENSYTNEGTIVEGELRFEEGSYVLGPNNDQHMVHSIKWKAKCKKEEADAKLIRGRYRATAVVMASGSSFGRATQMVFTEQKNSRNPIVSVRVKRKNGQ